MSARLLSFSLGCEKASTLPVACIVAGLLWTSTMMS